MKYFFYFLDFLFTLIFIVASWNSISKYREDTIAVAWKEYDIVDVQYPSVRRCLSIYFKTVINDKNINIPIISQHQNIDNF